MKSLEDEFGNNPSPENANAPQISKEEWHMQEALRQLGESTRQQQ